MASCSSHASSAALARLLNRGAVFSNGDISDVLADYFDTIQLMGKILILV